MITLENTYLKVEIALLGAELKSVVSKQTELEYMWNANPEYWGRTSPVLFPIVGRLVNDTYYHQEKKYSMGQHGIARDEMFTLISQKESEVVFSLESDAKTKEKYPFDFKLTITYILKNERLDVKWNVVNPNDDVTLPFSIGAHPAFSTHLFDAMNIEDYYFEFSQEENLKSWNLNENGNFVETSTNLGTSDGLRLSAELFANDALVFSNFHSSTVTLKNMLNDRAITMDLEKFTYKDEKMLLGIWTPYAQGSVAPFVCIEPWFGHADKDTGPFEISQKSGIISLGSRDEFVAEYGLIFK